MNKNKRQYKRRPDKTYIKAIEYMVKHELTLRELSSMWNIPKTTLHQFARRKLPHKNPKLYAQVHFLFEKNLKNWKGGHANGLRKMD